jgi:hypothetical protein
MRIMDAMTPVRRGSLQLSCVVMERQRLVLHHFGWESAHYRPVMSAMDLPSERGRVVPPSLAATAI